MTQRETDHPTPATPEATEREALADALASATPETLREDAALLVRIAQSFALEADTSQEFLAQQYRLAALALAVAMMEEQNLGVTIPDDVAPYNRDVYMRYDFTTVAEAPSLPAALAALLKGGA